MKHDDRTACSIALPVCVNAPASVLQTKYISRVGNSTFLHTEFPTHARTFLSTFLSAACSWSAGIVRLENCEGIFEWLDGSAWRAYSPGIALKPSVVVPFPDV